MRTHLLIGALALTYGVSSLAGYAFAPRDAQPPAPPSFEAGTPKLSSEYLCHGVINDKTYELTLVIRPLGGSYHVRWMNDAVVSMEGLAVGTDDYLAVAIVTGRGGIGAAIYKVDGPVMAGTWTGGDGQVFPEVCKRRAMGV